MLEPRARDAYIDASIDPGEAGAGEVRLRVEHVAGRGARIRIERARDSVGLRRALELPVGGDLRFGGPGGFEVLHDLHRERVAEGVALGGQGVASRIGL